MKIVVTTLLSIYFLPAICFGQMCAPLPEPTGNTVNVVTPAELVSAVNSADPGDTILRAIVL